MDGSEAAGSGSGNGNFSAAGVQSQPIKSAPMSSSRQQNSASDFSPYFLAAAAAASAQAEAAAAAAAGSSSSSTSASVQPPAPYTHTNSPFPVTIGSRMTQPAVCAAVSTQSRESGSSCRRRCSWAIISTRSIDLPFLYIDAADKQSFASSSIQSASFFDYVHPEEVARVGHDMRNIIDSHTLFGSVARCRYASPSLRKHGAAKRRTKEGDEYLAVDIVVNWIGDDMALCFFHAIIDESAQDNDEYNKSDWSNWCGMLPGSFDQAEGQTLWQSILKHRSLQPSSSGAQSVFQILSAPSQAEEPPQPTQPQILFSWPPPRLNSLSAAHYTDGSYYVHDFARLAQGVEHLTLQKEAGDANTSCTRRFRAKHTLTTEGMIRGVESVLIPYGSILLACFQVSYVQILPAAPASSHVKPTSTPSFRSLVDASVSAAQQEGRVQGIVGQVDEVRQSEDPSDTSVATLAAVAAAAAAQSKSCVSCGSRSSPEWRKGPDGTKCLCNACGLRFSRNVSKAKRRDERAQIAAQVAANGGIIPPHLRQKLSEQRKKSYKKVKAVDKEEGKAKVAEYGQETAQESSLAIEPAPIVPPDGQEVGQSSTK